MEANGRVRNTCTFTCTCTVVGPAASQEEIVRWGRRCAAATPMLRLAHRTGERERTRERTRFLIACGVLSALSGAGAEARGQSSVDERIARVEQGLLPRAVPK